MAEYIEREALLRHKTLIPGFIGEYVLVERIKEAPAADVEPVKRGEWHEDRGIIICSECGRAYNLVPIYAHYCPNCGADMRGSNDE